MNIYLPSIPNFQLYMQPEAFESSRFGLICVHMSGTNRIWKGREWLITVMLNVTLCCLLLPMQFYMGQSRWYVLKLSIDCQMFQMKQLTIVAQATNHTNHVQCDKVIRFSRQNGNHMHAVSSSWLSTFYMLFYLILPLHASQFSIKSYVTNAFYFFLVLNVSMRSSSTGWLGTREMRTEIKRLKIERTGQKNDLIVNW